VKFSLKLFRKWSFFEQIQQPLHCVEPFERILRGLGRRSYLIFHLDSNKQHFFSGQGTIPAQIQVLFFFSILEIVLVSRYELFAWFPTVSIRSAHFSKLPPPRNLQSWFTCYGQFQSLEKNFKVWGRISVDQIHSGGEGYIDWWCLLLSL